jgi:hypothetical protein
MIVEVERRVYTTSMLAVPLAGTDLLCGPNVCTIRAMLKPKAGISAKRKEIEC